MKTTKPTKLIDWDEMHRFQHTFLSNSKIVTSPKVHATSQFLTLGNNKRKVQQNSLKLKPSAVDLIKSEKRALHDYRELKTNLNIVKTKKEGIERQIDLKIDTFDAIPNKMKNPQFEGKIQLLGLKNSSFIKHMNSSAVSSDIGLKLGYKEKKSTNFPSSSKEMAESSIKADSHIKTFLFNECLQNDRPEVCEYEPSVKVAKNISKTLGNERISKPLKPVSIRKDCKKKWLQQDKGPYGQFIIRKGESKIGFTKYNQNNENFNTIYLNTFKKEIDKKAELKSALKRLKIPKEWKTYNYLNYGNYTKSFFTKFMTEKHYIGTPY